ncbi:sensor histidine kinase [Paenibacillus sp. IB182493]|uniref:histidine kinase n=2 Tax=Paenibacillus arenilitoris TaxID=2772299 RepID=A0A927H609_9BACL|nr:sensor histidine kinase [Paenibacillus arenilitoris]
MTYKQIKWLILTIPTLTIGVWEYVRHEFLLPYISMELGNWLAPVFVLIVSLLFLTQLFTMIEHNQEELNRAKALHAVLEEREKIARELHDGIAQSLFFLNAQLTNLEKNKSSDGGALQKLKESVHRTNDYVRQAIASLRHAADAGSIPWLQSVDSLIAELRHETRMNFETTWSIPEAALSSKEKVELLAIIREALLNIHKHADAEHVRLETMTAGSGWTCRIVDDGKGFNPEEVSDGRRYGLKMMQDRARMMSWRFDISRTGGETIVEVRKGES